MQHSSNQQIQPIGSMIRRVVPDRPLPGYVSKVEVYRPDLCPTCKCELKIGVHGFVSGGYDMYAKKTIVIPCPTCTTGAEAQSTAIKQWEMAAKLFNGALLPFGTRDWTFQTYPREADRNALSITKDFVQRWKDGDEQGKRGLFLGGQTGRCKTSLAISAIKEVMEAGTIGLFVSVPDLLKRIQATYNRDSQISESELLNTVHGVPWLVLDDLGVEKPSDFAIREFYLIIDKRRMSGLWTIITSNLSTKDLESYWRPADIPAGGFHAGQRVVERIREYCLGIEVQGRNQRAVSDMGRGK